jgi:hypothetical protein
MALPKSQPLSDGRLSTIAAVKLPAYTLYQRKERVEHITRSDSDAPHLTSSSGAFFLHSA